MSVMKRHLGGLANDASKKIAPDDGTKQRLLAAAADLFERKGFEATSIREITIQAEANLAAINHHFRSKQALFAAVINQKIEPLKKRFPQVRGVSVQQLIPLKNLNGGANFLFRNRNYDRNPNRISWQ
jgi:AcrR family transcriptional regulator